MLQCHLCQKPFTNASSHTRHVRYCLRTRNKPRVRQKSCQACSASKVKCTFQRSCARCYKKGIECLYDGEELPNRRATPAQPDSQDAVPVSIEPWQLSLNLTSEDRPGPIDWTAMDLFLPAEFSTPHEATGIDIETVQPLLLYDGSSSQYADLVSGSISNTTSGHDVSSAETLSRSTSDSNVDGGATQRETSTSPNNLTLSPWSPLPTGLAHPTILTPLNPQGRGHCHNSATQFSITSLIRGLRSYPLMMLQKETFPPLIHPHLLDMHDTASSPFSLSEAEPFTNSALSAQATTPSSIISKCMSIAHLYALRTPETTPFLWDAILEQTNFFAAHLHTLPPASLISAIQAQLIYIIMRIVANSPSSPQPESLNLSYSIMYVFKHLCETYVLKYGTEELYYNAYMAPPSPPTPGFIRNVKSEWEDFIISESWRRMKVIFWLISKIVDVNMGASVRCTARYSDVEWIMLPCGRGEWEARDECEWERMRKVRGIGLGFGGTGIGKRTLDTIGSLLEAHRGTMEGAGFGGGSEMGGTTSLSCADALDRWNAEVDGLGALLNAALGMI
ncbi:hypothetical protein V8F20_012063 [Naviculisporaceae sp. PSN 640]